MKINDKVSIGEGAASFVIAEIGSNHGQDFQLALDTIDAAVEAGADAVKFQSLAVNELYLEPSAEIQKLHQAIDLDESWHQPLKEHCDKRGIIFFSTPTYLKSVDLLSDLSVDLFKLASAQIGTFPQLIERVAQTGKPTLLSTGLVSYSELEQVIKIFERNGNKNYCILHCNSIYPTPADRVFLGRMEIYRKMFGCPVGFSDHTDGIAVATAAVALGADVIEKHFILKRGVVNAPDEPFSLEPAELQAMIQSIRTVEAASSTDVRIEIEPEESRFKESIRYRAILARNRMAGDSIRDGDIRYLRHPKGIDAVQMMTLLSQDCITARALPAGHLLERSDISIASVGQNS
ncbi:N-acetylneuraminate synthase [Rhodopirellula maiorica SM1]|uniref:N-acetylneuraminate synthase n=2 Tax=Novipirellula TaxID=2795426 RepID=M5S2X6_9BACT|nr:N-acetylneuraminate synthase [Rhodopirellula maiorica SM1]